MYYVGSELSIMLLATGSELSILLLAGSELSNLLFVIVICSEFELRLVLVAVVIPPSSFYFNKLKVNFICEKLTTSRLHQLHFICSFT